MVVHPVMMSASLAHFLWGLKPPRFVFLVCAGGELGILAGAPGINLDGPSSCHANINLRQCLTHVHYVLFTQIPFAVSLSNIIGDINWKIKSAVTNPLSKRSKAVPSNTMTNDLSPDMSSRSDFHLSQAVISHKFEIRVFSVVFKEVVGTSTRNVKLSKFDIKMHYLYSVKTANIKVDFVTLVSCCVTDRHPIGRDRFHLPPNDMSTALDSSIESSWPLKFVTSNKEGFIGYLLNLIDSAYVVRLPHLTNEGGLLRA